MSGIDFSPFAQSDMSYISSSSAGVVKMNIKTKVCDFLKILLDFCLLFVLWVINVIFLCLFIGFKRRKINHLLIHQAIQKKT